MAASSACSWPNRKSAPAHAPILFFVEHYVATVSHGLAVGVCNPVELRVIYCDMLQQEKPSVEGGDFCQSLDLIMIFLVAAEGFEPPTKGL